MSFENIPAEMKRLIQWCVWRYEQPNPQYPHILTKVPYNPRNGRRASVIDPQSWSTFEQVTQAARDLNKWAGIGFVFSSRDPYCGIDLDNPAALNPDGSPKFAPEKRAEIVKQQQFIFEKFVSYAEYSPSGTGLHIIIKGNVPEGKKRDAVEVYSSNRFFTMTGNVYRNEPINDHNAMVNRLWSSMLTHDNANIHGFIPSLNQTYDDRVIFEMAAKAVNGDKFTDLYNGGWSAYYSSQSEADFALINIIAFYTQNVAQIVRMFRESALGRRDKASRNDYVNKMVQRSFDQQGIKFDISAILDTLPDAPVDRASTAAGEQTPQSPVTGAGRENHQGAAASVDAKVAAPFAVDLNRWINQRPPGILNEIINYSLASSPRPVYEISLVAALGLLSGIVGRQYNTSTGTGLNQYLMLIADTGSGKEAIAATINKLISAIDKDTHPAAIKVLGPGDIASGQGLLKYFSRDTARDCFVSVVGEFGIKLKQITSDRAVTAEKTLLKVLLDLYTKSGAGNTLQPTVYSDKEKDTKPLHSPAFTLIGESTGETFYEALDESAVASGLLPRFTIVEYNGPRVKLNDNYAAAPEYLVMAISTLIYAMDGLAQKHTVNLIQETPEATTMLKRINEFCDDQMNGTGKNAIKQIWNRTHLKVLRLAGLLAVSHNYMTPVIDVAMVEWAASLIMTDAYRLVDKFAKGEMGTEDIVAKQLDLVKHILKDYYYNDMSHLVGVKPELWQEHYITRSFLQSRCRSQTVFKKSSNSKRAFDDAISDALANGWISRTVASDTEKVAKYGGTIFKIVSGVWLNEG